MDAYDMKITKRATVIMTTWTEEDPKRLSVVHATPPSFGELLRGVAEVQCGQAKGMFDGDGPT
jgi:hypothetical protein